jgi:hypothetical protein
MNRIQSLCSAIPLGALAVGPVVTLVSYFVRWPFGLTSFHAFTDYAHLTLAIGMAIGLISGLACGITCCRPLSTALLAGVATFALNATWAILQTAAGRFPPEWARGATMEAVINGVAAAVTGYLTAVVAVSYERKLPRGGRRVAQERPTPESGSRRHHI